MKTVTLIAALAVGVNGTPRNSGDGVALVVPGGGSSFQRLAQADLTAAYNGLDVAGSEVEIEYASVNSRQGINGLADRYVFAGSDAISNNPSHISYPFVAGGVAVVFNVPGFTGRLNLTADALAGIFTGTITQWNDAAITAQNPGFTFGADTIKVVARSGTSGTTLAFMRGLEKMKPARADNLVSESYLGFRTSLESSTQGIIKYIFANEFSIGYMDLSEAMDKQLTIASVQNPLGEFVTPTGASVSAAVSGVTDAMNQALTMNVAKADAYPLVTFTYIVMQNLTGAVENTTHVAKVRNALRFIHWVLDEQSKLPNIALQSRGYAPLSIEMRKDVIGKLKQFTYGDRPLFGRAVCDMEGLCKNEGTCSMISPFQNPETTFCTCQVLFENQKEKDCSEHAPANFVNWDDPVAIVFIFFAVLGIVYNIALAIIIVVKSAHPIIKAMSPVFLLYTLVGTSMSYASVFFFIGEPTRNICAIRPFWLANTFGLVFGMLAAKNWRIYSIFGKILTDNSSITNAVLMLRFGVINSTIELVFNLVWQFVDPLVPTYALNADKYVVVACRSQNRTIETVMTSLLYAYNGGIVLLCIFLAYQTRNTSDMFNESRQIGFAVFTVGCLLCVGIPFVHIESLDYVTIFSVTSMLNVVCPTCMTGFLYTSRFNELFKNEYAALKEKFNMSLQRTLQSSSTSQKASGVMSSSGTSVWHVSFRRKRLGAQWISCAFVIIPEINIVYAVSDITAAAKQHIKIFETFKLSDMSFDYDETDEGRSLDIGCTLKYKVNQYIVEFKSKDFKEKFQRLFSRSQSFRAGGKGHDSTTSAADHAQANKGDKFSLKNDPNRIQRVQGWCSNFKDLMMDPVGIKYFEKYLESLYSAENIRFYNACISLKLTPSGTEAYLTKVKEIAKTFIQDDAEMQVNLPGSVKKQFLQKLTTSTADTLDPNILAASEKHIYSLMQTSSYPGFIVSPAIRALLMK